MMGGVSLKGGEGSVLAPLYGALFITVLSNGRNLTRVDGYIQQVALRLVIILAVVLDEFRRRKSGSVRAASKQVINTGCSFPCRSDRRGTLFVSSALQHEIR